MLDEASFTYDPFAREVMNVWADRGESLTYWQRQFVEFHVGSFRRAA